jgi:hypothetical protein
MRAALGAKSDEQNWGQPGLLEEAANLSTARHLCLGIPIISAAELCLTTGQKETRADDAHNRTRRAA